MLIRDAALEGGFDDLGVDVADEDPRTRTGLLHTAPLYGSCGT